MEGQSHKSEAGVHNSATFDTLVIVTSHEAHSPISGKTARLIQTMKSGGRQGCRVVILGNGHVERKNDFHDFWQVLNLPNSGN